MLTDSDASAMATEMCLMHWRNASTTSGDCFKHAPLIAEASYLSWLDMTRYIKLVHLHIRTHVSRSALGVCSGSVRARFWFVHSDPLPPLYRSAPACSDFCSAFASFVVVTCMQQHTSQPERARALSRCCLHLCQLSCICADYDKRNRELRKLGCFSTGSLFLL